MAAVAAEENGGKRCSNDTSKKNINGVAMA